MLDLVKRGSKNLRGGRMGYVSWDFGHDTENFVSFMSWASAREKKRPEQKRGGEQNFEFEKDEEPQRFDFYILRERKEIKDVLYISTYLFSTRAWKARIAKPIFYIKFPRKFSSGLIMKTPRYCIDVAI